MKWIIDEMCDATWKAELKKHDERLEEALIEVGRKHIAPIHSRIKELIKLLDPHLHIRKIIVYAGFTVEGQEVRYIHTDSVNGDTEEGTIACKAFFDDLRSFGQAEYEYPDLDNNDRGYIYELINLLEYNEDAKYCQDFYCQDFYYDEFEEKNTKKA